MFSRATRCVAGVYARAARNTAVVARVARAAPAAVLRAPTAVTSGVSRTAVRGISTAVAPCSESGKRSVAQDSADAVKALLPEGFQPRAGIVLGSGLGGVSDIIEDAVRIPYSDIPGFPVSTVSGHAGELVCGTLEGVPVAALKGESSAAAHCQSGGKCRNVPLAAVEFHC